MAGASHTSQLEGDELLGEGDMAIDHLALVLAVTILVGCVVFFVGMRSSVPPRPVPWQTYHFRTEGHMIECLNMLTSSEEWHIIMPWVIIARLNWRTQILFFKLRPNGGRSYESREPGTRAPVSSLPSGVLDASGSGETAGLLPTLR
jgi:hypothetical protein